MAITQAMASLQWYGPHVPEQKIDLELDFAYLARFKPRQILQNGTCCISKKLTHRKSFWHPADCKGLATLFITKGVQTLGKGVFAMLLL